jgi:SAM-dependent methyltransferase
MHPIILERFRTILGRIAIQGPVLEIGAEPSAMTLLALPELAALHRIGVNMGFPAQMTRWGFRLESMNANDMPAFASDSFGLVLCNAVLEHDRFFWRTIDEIHRLVRPGGFVVIGTPGYGEHPLPAGVVLDPARAAEALAEATVTYRLHDAPGDYYRFTEAAMRDVFLRDFEVVEVGSVMVPPRVIGVGRKVAAATPISAPT